MTYKEKQSLLNEQYNIKKDREALLTSKDYIGTKIAMGVATIDDYTKEIAETEVWRQELRAANAEIERLEAIEVEPEEPVDPIES